MTIFYEITTPSGKKSYVFGTLHLADQAVNTLPVEVAQAFQNASILIEEIDFNQSSSSIKQECQASRKRWERMHLSAHQAWCLDSKQLEATIDKILPFFSWMVPRAYVRRLVLKKTPMELAVYLTDQRDSQSLDKNLIKRANKYNKKVCGLERVESQVDILLGTDLNYDHQRKISEQLIQDFLSGKRKAYVEKLKKMYINGEGYMTPSRSSSKHCVYGAYHDILIHQRDEKMVGVLEEYLNQGHVFIAVGAAHLPGISKAYRAKPGYQVKEIPLSERLYPVLDFRTRNQYEMLKTALLFMASVCIAVGIIFASQVLPTVVLALALIVSAVLCLIAFYKTVGLIHAYFHEPVWPAATDAQAKKPQQVEELSRESFFAQTKKPIDIPSVYEAQKQGPQAA